MADVRDRRGAIDVARTLSLLLVAAGHMAMFVVDRDSTGALRGDNVLALHPTLAFLGLLAPMPVFFAAAGWSHAGGSTRSVGQRIAPLVTVAAVVCSVWSATAIVSVLVTGGSNTVTHGARVATQPMWFLTAYVPFVAFSHMMTRLSRYVFSAIGAAFVAVTITDWLRFAHDVPRVVGFPGFFLVWGVPWILGAWWRNMHEAGSVNERRIGVLLAIAGLVACAALVRWADYSPSLIDAVPGRRTNTTPPTLFTLTASIAQVGILMIVARPLDRIALRWRAALDRIATLSTGIYAWHLSALALCAATIAVGLPGPTRFGVTWWATRPIWFTVVVDVTIALALATRRVVEHVARRTSHRQHLLTHSVAVLLATAGAGLTGLYGPRSIPMALAIIACLCSATTALRIRIKV